MGADEAAWPIVVVLGLDKAEAVARQAQNFHIVDDFPIACLLALIGNGALSWARRRRREKASKLSEFKAALGVGVRN